MRLETEQLSGGIDIISKMVPSEYEEQCAFVEYLELKKLKFTAIPNSTYTKSFNQKRRNKCSGLRPGLPDLLVVLPEQLLFIEMKRTKGGRLSLHQKGWIEALNKINNVEAIICKGAGEAIDAIETRLKNPH